MLIVLENCYAILAIGQCALVSYSIEWPKTGLV